MDDHLDSMHEQADLDNSEDPHHNKIAIDFRQYNDRIERRQQHHDFVYAYNNSAANPLKLQAAELDSMLNLPIPKSSTTQASSSNQCGPSGQTMLVRSGLRSSSTAASHLIESAHQTGPMMQAVHNTPHGQMTAFQLSGQQSAEQQHLLAPHERMGISTQHSVPSGKQLMTGRPLET